MDYRFSSRKDYGNIRRPIMTLRKERWPPTLDSETSSPAHIFSGSNGSLFDPQSVTMSTRTSKSANSRNLLQRSILYLTVVRPSGLDSPAPAISQNPGKPKNFYTKRKELKSPNKVAFQPAQCTDPCYTDEGAGGTLIFSSCLKWVS